MEGLDTGNRSVNTCAKASSILPGGKHFISMVSTRCRLVAGCARGKFVAAIVVAVIGVAFGPRPGGLVTVDLFVEGLPQVLIDDGLLGGGEPAFAFPAVDPGGDAVLDVFGIGDDFHLSDFAQGSQASDGGGELHAVVGGMTLGPPDFFLQFFVAEDGGPAAGTGVTE